MAEKNIKRRWGDRREGRLLRTLDPYHIIPAFIMVERNDACNYFTDSFEVSELDRYLRRRRTEGLAGLGMLHVITAAYLRLVSRYPGLNRFVSGQRVFARHDFELVMTIKSELKLESPETSVKIKLEVTDTIDDVYRKLNAEFEKVKNMNETATDSVAAAFRKIPRLLLKFVIFSLKFLDYFGLLPQVIMRASPFHGSLIITDLGSIGMPPIYHHLYNFGNLPVFLAMGAKRKVYENERDGTIATRKYIDMAFVVDERVVDGFYFSQVYRYFKAILKNPELLELPPEEVVCDID